MEFSTIAQLVHALYGESRYSDADVYRRLEGSMDEADVIEGVGHALASSLSPVFSAASDLVDVT